MSRHGESINNRLNIIGGDCYITLSGKTYAIFLKNYFDTPVTVWTSTLNRTKETARELTYKPVEWEELNEIYSGDFDGMVLDNIRTDYPEQYTVRNGNKMTKSYPNGETYQDLEKRVLIPLLTIDTAATGTLLIIAHKAVCRVIYSYFTGIPLEDCVNKTIELHTLYKLEGTKFIPVYSNL